MMKKRIGKAMLGFLFFLFVVFFLYAVGNVFYTIGLDAYQEGYFWTAMMMWFGPIVLLSYVIIAFLLIESEK